MKTVIETKKTTLDNVTTKKVYGFVGSNGELYILGRKPDGNYFFNSINKTGKPVNEYSSLEEALKDKMDNGFDILESSVLFLHKEKPPFLGAFLF